jgi:hypothetical protein
MCETQVAIRQATLKMHSLEYFARDMATAEIRFPAASPSLSLPIASNLLRCRKVFQVAQNGQELEHIQANDIFTSSALKRVNAWWAVGDSLVLRTNGASAVFSVSWFVAPQVDPIPSYNSWIAEAHPYAIIDEAARVVAELTGRAELAASLARNVGSLPLNGALASGHIAELLRNNETVGW